MLRIAHEQMHVGVTVEPDDLYDDYTHQIHHRVGELIHDRAYAVGLPAHWTAIKLIEGDELVEKALDLNEITKSRLESVCREYEDAYALGDRETLIADSRYQFIQNVVRVSVKKGRPHGALTRSDQIDSIVTNKYLAIPVFLLMMLAMFALTLAPWVPSLRRSGDAGGRLVCRMGGRGSHCRRSGALGQLPVGGGCDRGCGGCA